MTEAQSQTPQAASAGWNIARISLTSFLAYFIMSAIITPLGIVNQPIAEYFSIPITASTAVFSSLTTGILVGSSIAIFVFEHLRIKSVVLLAAALIGVSLLVIYPLDNFAGLIGGLFFTGVGCGISLSSAAAVITKAYREKFRPSMLLLTDSFYSAAATFSSFLAVYLISAQWHWWSAYLLALGAIACLLLVAAVSQYPEAPVAVGEDGDVQERESILGWPVAVHLCGAALMLYLLGIVTVYSWVPHFAQTVLGMEQAAAGNLVGRMFTGMFFGQLVMFLLVLRLPVKMLLTACLLLASLMTACIWVGQQVIAMQTVMLLLGLIGGGILKVAISFGTTLSPNPTPKMVSYLMFYTALGTAIAPALSAWVVELTGAVGVMAFATGCYVATILLLVLSFLTAGRGKIQPGTAPSGDV